MLTIDLQILILRSGFKKYEIAHECGWSESYLSKLLRGADVPEEKAGVIIKSLKALQEGKPGTKG